MTMSVFFGMQSQFSVQSASVVLNVGAYDKEGEENAGAGDDNRGVDNDGTK